MHHAAIELPLHQKSNHEPINSDETVMRALVEQQYQSHYDCERRLEDNIHIPKKSEDKS